MFENNRKNKLVFIAIGLLLCFATALLWGYLAIAYYVQTGFVALLIGFIQGTNAGLFLIKNQRRSYLGWSWFLAIYAILGGMYLEYAYIFEGNYFSSGGSQFGVLFQIMAEFKFASIFRFFMFKVENGLWYSLFWVLISLVLATHRFRKAPDIKGQYFRLRKFLNSRYR